MKQKVINLILVIVMVAFLLQQAGWAGSNLLRPTAMVEKEPVNSDVISIETERIIEIDSWTTFSNDLKRAVSITDDGARVWNIETGKTVAKLRCKRWYQYFFIPAEFTPFAALSPDGKQVISANTGGGNVIIWDAERGKHLAKLEGHKHRIWALVFSLDGKKAITRGKSVKVWDIASKNASVIKLKSKAAPLFNSTVALSPDGNRAVIGYEDGTARIYEVRTGKRLLKLKGHKREVFAVSFSFDGRKVITGSHDCTARIWDSRSGRCLATLAGEHDAGIRAVAFSPDGTMVATAPWNDIVRIWDAHSGRNLACLKGHTDVVYHLCFSQDGKRLISASDDGTARIWNISRFIYTHPPIDKFVEVAQRSI